MLPFAIFAALGLTMFMMGGDDASDDTQDDPTPEPEDQATIVSLDDLYDDSIEDDTDDADPVLIDPETGAYLVGPGQTALGTDGDDLFQEVEGADYSEEGNAISISAGAGDDIVDFASTVQEAETLSTYSPPNIVAVSYIDGGAGNDNIDMRVSGSTITGGDGADIISNYSYLSTISGGSGDDTIETGSSRSTFYGGDGNDVMSTDGTPDVSTVYGGAGNDHIENYWSYGSELYGGDGNDTIIPGAGAIDYRGQVFGGAGDDMIDARGGYNLQVYGGDGDDTILLTPNGGYAQHGTYFGVSGGAGARSYHR